MEDHCLIRFFTGAIKSAIYAELHIYVVRTAKKQMVKATQSLQYCQSRIYELEKGPHIDSLDHNTEAAEVSHFSLLTHLNGDSTSVRQLQVEGGHRSCNKEWDPVYKRDTFIRC